MHSPSPYGLRSDGGGGTPCHFGRCLVLSPRPSEKILRIGRRGGNRRGKRPIHAVQLGRVALAERRRGVAVQGLLKEPDLFIPFAQCGNSPPATFLNNRLFLPTPRVIAGTGMAAVMSRRNEGSDFSASHNHSFATWPLLFLASCTSFIFLFGEPPATWPPHLLLSAFYLSPFFPAFPRAWSAHPKPCVSFKASSSRFALTIR